MKAKIAGAPGYSRADDTSKKKRAANPSQAQIAQVKLPQEKRPGAGDDPDIETEKQSAHGRRGSQKKPVPITNARVRRFGPVGIMVS